MLCAKSTGIWTTPYGKMLTKKIIFSKIAKINYQSLSKIAKINHQSLIHGYSTDSVADHQIGEKSQII